MTKYASNLIFIFEFAIAVWLALIMHSSCREDTNSVRMEDLLAAIREAFLMLIFRDDLAPARLKATSCPKQLAPCEVEWKWVNRRKVEEFSRQMKAQLRSNVSSLIDYYVIFWLCHVGGIRLLRYELNPNDGDGDDNFNQSEPLTLLKMLADLTSMDPMGRVFDNATVLAADYAITHRFDQLARCFLSVDHKPRFWEPEWTELLMEKRLAVVVFPYWLKAAVALVKNEPSLSREFEKQILETEVQVEENAPPVRLANRTSEWEIPIVMESVYARRYWQLVAEIEIRDYLLAQDTEVRLESTNVVGRFRFRHITNNAFLEALEELTQE